LALGDREAHPPVSQVQQVQILYLEPLQLLAGVMEFLEPLLAELVAQAAHLQVRGRQVKVTLAVQQQRVVMVVLAEVEQVVLVLPPLRHQLLAALVVQVLFLL
jgi:hypothetical protein